jgi:hypothetical protein
VPALNHISAGIEPSAGIAPSAGIESSGGDRPPALNRTERLHRTEIQRSSAGIESYRPPAGQRVKGRSLLANGTNIVHQRTGSQLHSSNGSTLILMIQIQISLHIPNAVAMR